MFTNICKIHCDFIMVEDKLSKDEILRLWNEAHTEPYKETLWGYVSGQNTAYVTVIEYELFIVAA